MGPIRFLTLRRMHLARRVLLRTDPQNATVCNKLGIAELMLQRFKEAGKDFERALKANHSFPEAYNNLGFAYYSLGENRKALDAIRRARWL